MQSDFDFKSTPQGRKAKGNKPTLTLPEGTQAQDEDQALDDALEKQEAPENKGKPKYNPDELAAIFDEILFNQEYSEEVTIRGKLKVVFRTRSADEMREINQVVDSTQAVFSTTLDGVRSFLQLQYSLSFYHGKDLRSLKNEDKAKFIGNLPSPVVAALLMELGKFDEKVYAACKEAEENF
ncbi:MAG TPA: hypothetical protein VFM18_08635 [Methanosarcina sp.]|nr:hypothetical protein [Methanosarcina sp.]